MELQDSIIKLEGEAVDDANELRNILLQDTREKEAKHQQELGLITTKYRIQELEDELRNAIAEKSRSLISNLERETKLKADKEIFAKKFKQVM